MIRTIRLGFSRPMDGAYDGPEEALSAALQRLSLTADVLFVSVLRSFRQLSDQDGTPKAPPESYEAFVTIRTPRATPEGYDLAMIAQLLRQALELVSAAIDKGVV